MAFFFVTVMVEMFLLTSYSVTFSCCVSWQIFRAVAPELTGL